MSRKVYVYENYSSNDPKKCGILYVDNIRGDEVYSFEYDDNWLISEEIKFPIAPSLPLTKGRLYPSNKKLFGIFQDASPDRWGKTLMNRRERIIADKEDRKSKTLTEIDYLLGVYDKTRMGALRFKTDENEDFVSSDDEQPTPPWESLRTLENASIEFEKSGFIKDEKWVRELLQPGSSLGGARPKAIVVDPSGELWIAKFPSKDDSYDKGVWEKIIHDLARLCGLNVPESRLEKFSSLGSTFLVKRFDRLVDKRIHFVSAMTMLNKTDGENASIGVSYLNLVSFIKAESCSPNDDLKELWKRVAFSMAVRNTDDHLRNHGFILTNDGWRLSPLYDVNPNPFGNELSLNVNEGDNRIKEELLLEIAPLCGIKNEEGQLILESIKEIVKNSWEKIAKDYKVSRNEIEMMRNAFAFCDK